jgi:quercetin dioxygenase-like cupin family protein
LSGTVDVVSISFRETRAGGAVEWHDAPARQFVITLSGTLDFQTRTGEHFMLHPGDILLAEDTAGSGHSWKLIDENPWRRAYGSLAQALRRRSSPTRPVRSPS